MLLPFLIVLFLIKLQNLLILLIFFYFYLVYKKINNLRFLIFNFLLISVILFLYADFIVEEINLRRRGLYEEEFGRYRGISSLNTYENISFDLNLIIISLKSLFMFITAPIFTTTNWFKLIALVEILFLYIFFIRYFFIDKKIEINNVIIFWLVILIVSFTFYSLAVFNDGSIQRYRLELIFFHSLVIICINIKFWKINYMLNKVLIIGFGSIAKRHIKNLIKIQKNIFFYILSRKKKLIQKK